MLHLKISSIKIFYVILCSYLIKHNFILFKNVIVELFFKFQVIYKFDYNTPCSRINIASVNMYETFPILLVASSKFYSCKQRGVTFAVVVEVKNKYCLVLGLARGSAATFRTEIARCCGTNVSLSLVAKLHQKLNASRSGWQTWDHCQKPD